MIKTKTIEELKTINSKNLLRYYKAERKRFYGSGYWCGCGCGDMSWEVHPANKHLEQEYTDHNAYLNLIKSELNNREHISK